MPEGRPKRRRRAIIATILVAAVVWLVAVVVALAAAAADISVGVVDVDSLREDTDIEAIAEGTAVADMRSAAERFRSASDKTGGLLLAPARILPVIGRQIRSANALASTAATVLEVGADAIADASPLLDQRPKAGRARVQLLRDLATLAGDAHERLQGLDLGPDEALLGPLASARTKMERELVDVTDRLDAAATVAAGLADMFDGPRTYILVAANNAEMRAGSGMWLSAGPMRTHAGAIDLGRVRSVADINPPRDAVRVRDDFGARWGWLEPQNEWRNLMLSPRLDMSAPLAAQMWRAAGLPKADGVIVLDPVALEGILRAVGPVRSGGRQIGADDVVDELLYDQYVRFSDDPIALRRAALSGVAGEAMAALDERAWDPVALVRGLADAAAGRHLMAWSRHEGEQRAFASAGIDGAMDDASLMVSVLNRGGNKLDRWLDVDARLRIEPDDARDRSEAELTITLENRAPLDAPAYVAGPNPGHGTSRGEYFGYVAVSMPGGSGGARISGAGRLVALGEDGPSRVIAAEVRIPRGGTRTVRVRFTFGARAGSLFVEPSARVPALNWRFHGLTWEDVERRHVSWGALSG